MKQKARASLLVALVLTGCLDGPVGNLRSYQEEEPSDAGGEASDVEAGGPVSFARDIRPLMSRPNGTRAGCKECHYPAQPNPQGFDLTGLDLSTLGTLRKGGVSTGRGIVVPGQPDASALVQKLEGTYARGVRMPKDRGPWSVDEIALVRRWILEGAKGADDE